MWVGGVAIGVHCDAGEIMTKKCSRDQIGIFCLPRMKINEVYKDKTYIGRIPIGRPMGGDLG